MKLRSPQRRWISYIHLLIASCIIFPAASCSEIKQLGKNEKKWAFHHPFAALKIRKIKKKCDVYYAGMKKNPDLDTYENGGKLDAYRHLFYTLMFTTKVKTKKVISLGVAHEKDNYLMFLENKAEEGELADSVSCEMDLLNNREAIHLTRELHHEHGFETASGVCIKHIKTGNAYFIKRNEKGQYLTCDDQVIDMQFYQGKWNIPKCLVQK